MSWTQLRVPLLARFLGVSAMAALLLQALMLTSNARTTARSAAPGALPTLAPEAGIAPFASQATAETDAGMPNAMAMATLDVAAEATDNTMTHAMDNTTTHACTNLATDTTMTLAMDNTTTHAFTNVATDTTTDATADAMTDATTNAFTDVTTHAMTDATATASAATASAADRKAAHRTAASAHAVSRAQPLETPQAARSRPPRARATRQPRARPGMARAPQPRTAASAVTHPTALTARATVRRFPIPILTYHHIVPDDAEVDDMVVRKGALRRHIVTLRERGWTIVGLDEVLAAINGAGSLTPFSVAITFDDGWRDQYEHALPVLDELDAPATFFLVTDPIDAGWPGVMTWTQARELRDRGAIIGSHTRSHEGLVGLDEERLADEIAGSAASIEANLGERPTLFSYPYGEYDDAALAFVADSGYGGAVTVSPDSWASAEARLELPRLAVRGHCESKAAFLSCIGVFLQRADAFWSELGYRRASGGEATPADEYQPEP